MSDILAEVVPQSVVSREAHMADTPTSPQYRLLDMKLGTEHHGATGLERYVLSRRKLGLSWAEIAGDIRDDTGERVSDETLRRWFGDRDTYPNPPP